MLDYIGFCERTLEIKDELEMIGFTGLYGVGYRTKEELKMKDFNAKVSEVVEFDNGKFGIVIINSDDELGVSSPDNWFPLNTIKRDGGIMSSTRSIVKVWSRSGNMYAHNLGIKGRKVIWEYKEEPKPKELTVLELEKLLGYKIKVVGGDK